MEFFTNNSAVNMPVFKG